ncbi:hypothetical protein L6452_42841 [Arctium lappa]|uniref:Uncharacterized protein n=1 Tax=Arctium lappa TaxID=4217 RepID=A0ACB8XKJ5_ARCLA|nr:hypothetical protein L6452_42841 [Arctium lappa]
MEGDPCWLLLPLVGRQWESLVDLLVVAAASWTTMRVTKIFDWGLDFEEKYRKDLGNNHHPPHIFKPQLHSLRNHPRDPDHGPRPLPVRVPKPRHVPRDVDFRQ